MSRLSLLLANAFKPEAIRDQAAFDALEREMDTMYLDGQRLRQTANQDIVGTWEPRIYQAGFLTGTVTFAYYQIRGNLITAVARILPTQTGTATTAMRVYGLPARILGDVSGDVFYPTGVMQWYDAAIHWKPTTYVVNDALGTGIFGIVNGYGAGIGVTPDIAVASGQVIAVNVTYVINREMLK